MLRRVRSGFERSARHDQKVTVLWHLKSTLMACRVDGINGTSIAVKRHSAPTWTEVTMNRSESVTYRMFAVLISMLSIPGCSKKPPPDEVAAQGSSAMVPGKGPRQPPAELLAACDGKKSGDACSLKRGDHDITGQCVARPGNDQEQPLLCRPARSHSETQ